MATRSSISIIKEDGTVSQVYCHWDGYISHNGVILFTYYQDADKVKELVNLGDMSSLGSEIIPTGNHSFDNPQDNVTVFFGRDRGEDDTKPNHFKDFKDFLKKGNFQEYNYIYKEKTKKWYLLDKRENKLKALKGLVEKELPNIADKYKKDFLNLIKKQKEEKEKSEPKTLKPKF
jgi:hypothetical protein